MIKASNLANPWGAAQNRGMVMAVPHLPGEGSAYNVYMPGKTPSVQAKSGPKVTRPQKAPGTILVVDDDEMILEVMSEMLRILGYGVLTADHGQKALDIYQGEPDAIDLVLLDIVMPELTGDVVFEKLKQIDPDVKVICASGYCSQTIIEKMMAGGCCGYFPKPVNIEELSRHVRKVMEQGDTPEQAS